MTDQRPRAPAGDESTTATIISPAETRPEPSFGTAIASAAPGVRPSVAGATERGAVLDIVEHYGLLVLLVAVGAFFCVYPATHASFFSGANFVTLAGNQTVVAIVALAALLPMSAGYIDLSSGAITGVASCTFATCLTRFHQDILISLVAAIVVALACGTVNGILVARWGLSAIIATLGSQLALLGLIEWYTNDQTIGGGMSQNLIAFGSDNFLGIPEITWIFIPVLLAAWFLLEHTPFGRYLQAISSNRRSARLVGINVKRSVLLCFATAGVIAGIAGALLSIRQGGADATTGPSYLFPALTGVFLGATVVHPGRPNVWGTIVGIVFLAVIVSGLTLLGATSWAPDLLQGLLLIGATALSTIFARERGGTGIF